MANLLQLEELRSRLGESRLQLERHGRELKDEATELVNLGTSDICETFTSKDARRALKYFETMGFLAGILKSDSNVQEQWHDTVLDKLRSLKELVLGQCAGDILEKPALAVGDMQLRLSKLKAWSDAADGALSCEFHGAEVAVNEFFEDMVALPKKQAASGIEGLLPKCKIALHLKHMASEVNASLWDGKASDLQDAAQEALQQTMHLLEISKVASIDLVKGFLKTRDPTDAALLERIKLAFGSLMSARAEVENWRSSITELTVDLERGLSTAISELIEASRTQPLQEEVDLLVREKQFDSLEAPLKSLWAFSQVLPLEIAQKSGAANASADSMRRVLLAAEHVSNELEEFFRDLLASKEVYIEKPMKLLAAFKAARWLDQLCEDMLGWSLGVVLLGVAILLSFAKVLPPQLKI